jgi:hypothetical protein
MLAGREFAKRVFPWMLQQKASLPTDSFSTSCSSSDAPVISKAPNGRSSRFSSIQSLSLTRKFLTMPFRVDGWRGTEKEGSFINCMVDRTGDQLRDFGITLLATRSGESATLPLDVATDYRPLDPVNLYPTPGAVTINTGCLGFSSSLSRKLATCMSTVRVSVPLS